ncbi:MAG: acylphosphatase [Phycisphaeraceae bacterium]|nr:acylphosphatase [Phycisphaeraceae bacterium]MBX3367737.1 acylphosphatase [Phycisphaeraceae bacterium]
MQRIRVTFSGRVQGVGFRASVVDVAAGSDVTGWVRNQHDGTVCMEVQGESQQIEDVLSRVRTRFRGMITGEDRCGVELVDDEVGFSILR